MKKSPQNKIDPQQMFLHGDGFVKAKVILENIDPNNIKLNMAIAAPVMVTTALAIEIFLKCLNCIESGEVPHGHHLKNLYDSLVPATRKRIDELWDTHVVPMRTRDWDQIALAMKENFPRDLPGMLIGGNEAFEKIRYSYEGKMDGVKFFLGDLPKLLGQVILEKKPEWTNLERNLQTLATYPKH
jgi:hypothetical protein